MASSTADYDVPQADSARNDSERLFEAYQRSRGEVPDGDAERLREERDFWRSMFEQLVAEFPDGILVADDEGTLTHWNDVLARNLNITREEALGSNAGELIDAHGESEALVEEVAQTGEVIKEEDVREVPSSDVVFQVLGVPLRGPDGTIAGGFSVATDVTRHIERQRELEELREKVRNDLGTPVEELGDSVDEVVNFANETESFASEQMERMNEVAGELSEQSATIQEIAASAEQVNQAGKEAESVAEEGSEAASDAIERMEAVEATAADVTESIDELTDQADEIDGIVEVINDIADQTNMLALNASIEAARAGDAGEGFAVVAEEVKGLAEESQEQAARIEGMISTMVETTERTASELDETTAELQAGIEAVETAVGSLDRITEAVEETASGAEEVADATEDHAQSTEAVAAMVDDAAESLEELETQLERLSRTTESQYEQVDAVESAMRDLSRESGSR